VQASRDPCKAVEKRAGPDRVLAPAVFSSQERAKSVQPLFFLRRSRRDPRGDRRDLGRTRRDLRKDRRDPRKDRRDPRKDRRDLGRTRRDLRGPRKNPAAPEAKILPNRDFPAGVKDSPAAVESSRQVGTRPPAAAVGPCV